MPPSRRPCPGAVTLDDAIAAGLLPERPKRGHKGSFGKLLVIAGSIDYAGAALLVCRAAGRAGAGLVTLAVPESLQPLFAAKVVEATTMALPEDDLEEIDPEPALARILDHDHDAIVVGPGLRPGLATAELVRELLAGPGDDTPQPVVLDAEALRSLATMERWWEGDRRPSVMTPHAGEFERLREGSGHSPATTATSIDDDAARAEAARDAATTWGQVVVLKGAKTVIAAPGRIGGDRAVREPGACVRRNRRRAERDDRVAARPGAGAVRRRPGSASTSTASRATPCGSGSGTPGCSRRTCRRRSRSPGSGSRRSRSERRPPAGWASGRATTAAVRTRPEPAPDGSAPGTSR